jgi:hypothetical protein
MAQTQGRGYQGIDPNRQVESDEDWHAQSGRGQYRSSGGQRQNSISDLHLRAGFHHDTAAFHHRHAALCYRIGDPVSAELHAAAADKHGRWAWDHNEQAMRVGRNGGRIESDQSWRQGRDEYEQQRDYSGRGSQSSRSGPIDSEIRGSDRGSEEYSPSDERRDGGNRSAQQNDQSNRPSGPRI